MGSSQPPGPALVAAAADADPVTLLVTAWLSAMRSENTRTAYARDIGITPQQQPCRAPSWLTWCQQQEVHPVTGVTALHVTLYARQLDATGLSPASAARKLAAISSWYAWLVRRAHITASPAAGIARPRPALHTPAAPALTRDQALALIHAADTAPGPQRARTAALTAVLLLTSARLSEVTGADIADLGTSGGRQVLRVTRANGRRQDLPLPGAAASRIDAYLAGRASQAGDQALFATRTGRRLFAADVRRTLRRLATRARLPADQALHLGPRTIRQSFTMLDLQAGTPPGLHSSTRHAAPSTTPRPGRARDPDPPPWPRGRPHCRARRPQHATRHTRPRLSPKTLCGRPYQQLQLDEALHPPHGAHLGDEVDRLGRGRGGPDGAPGQKYGGAGELPGPSRSLAALHLRHVAFCGIAAWPDGPVPVFAKGKPKLNPQIARSGSLLRYGARRCTSGSPAPGSTWTGRKSATSHPCAAASSRAEAVTRFPLEALHPVCSS
jgi:integrase/recombinase XerD